MTTVCQHPLCPWVTLASACVSPSTEASPSLLAAEELLGSKMEQGKSHGESVRKGCCPGQDHRAVGCQLLPCLSGGHRHPMCGDGQQELPVAGGCVGAGLRCGVTSGFPPSLENCWAKHPWVPPRDATELLEQQSGP